MPDQARIRLSLTTGEFEVEGTEAFVAKYAEPINELIERLRERRLQTPAESTGGSSTSTSTTSGSPPKEFGEALHGLPKSATGTDQILLAGLYAQRESADSTFSTGEANQLLVGQGIKLTNPSQSLKNALTAKRAFKVGKRFRLSKTGEDHINGLTGQNT
jgi:hypothetical protein